MNWDALIALPRPDMAAPLLSSGLLLALAGYFLFLTILALTLLIQTIRLHRRNEAKAHKWHELEVAWQPVLAQVLIGAWPAARMHEQIRPEDGLFFVDFLTRYAQRGNSRQTLQELAAPWLPSLAERCEDGDDEQRARAIFTLSTLAPLAYRPQIARALNDPVPMVAMLAARSLAEHQAHEYLDRLLTRLERFKDWSQPSLTAMLVQIAQPEPALLRRALSQGQHPVWVQTLILRALNELDDAAAVPEAVRILQSAADAELQAAALDLLGHLGSGAHKALIATKCHSYQFGLRLHAVKALNQLADAGDEALLSELLDDDSVWIALHAAHGLKAIGRLAALEALAASERPRAELAQQVLAELDSDKFMRVAAQSADFAQQVPTWIEDVLQHPSTTAWRGVQQILLDPRTHDEVKLAIAQALTPDAAPFMYPAILRQLRLQQHDAPAWLYRALHLLNPLAANGLMREHFFSTQNDAARLEMLNLLLAYHTPANWAFVSELRKGLRSAFSGFSAELGHSIEEKLAAFEAGQQMLAPSLGSRL